MSAYKRLNKQDAYITSYTAKKSWRVSGSMLQGMGIEQYQATGSMLSSLNNYTILLKQKELLIHTPTTTTYKQP